MENKMINIMKKFGLLLALGLMVTACGGGGGGAGTAVTPSTGDDGTSAPVITPSNPALDAAQTAVDNAQDAVTPLLSENTIIVESGHEVKEIFTGQFGVFATGSSTPISPGVNGTIGGAILVVENATTLFTEDSNVKVTLLNGTSAIYSYIGGEWVVNSANAFDSAALATAEAALANAKADLFDTTGYDWKAENAIGSNGFGVASGSLDNDNWNVVNGDNSDSYFINDTGTGTKESAADATADANHFNGQYSSSLPVPLYGHAEAAIREGWSGRGTSIFHNDGASWGDLIAPEAINNNMAGTTACVINNTTANSCVADTGITIGVDQELNNLSIRSDGNISSAAENSGEIAGAVSLVWHKFNTLNDDQIQDLIEETADNATGTSTNKVINLENALSPVGNLN